MGWKLGDTITRRFPVFSLSTGGLVNADALPGAAVYEDDNDTAILSPTVVNVATGRYRVPIVAIADNGFEVGKSYNLVLTYAVGTINRMQVFTFTLDGKRVSDLNDIAAPDLSNLDVAVSTRAPESGGNVAAIKVRTDNLPSDPAGEANVQGHVADALAVYDPPTTAELEAAVSPLALEAGIEAHVLAVLNSYDPPTRAEATADKTAILAAVAALNDLTVEEILSGDLSDSLSLPANSLADLVRKLFWVVCNRLVITDASGAFTAYKTDGVTPAAAGTITDNGATTTRSKPTWP